MLVKLVKLCCFSIYFRENIFFASPWCGHKYGGEVTDCHGQQDTVGRRLKSWPGEKNIFYRFYFGYSNRSWSGYQPAKDSDDDGVGDEGDAGQEGHHHPQQGEDQVHGA